MGLVAADPGAKLVEHKGAEGLAAQLVPAKAAVLGRGSSVIFKKLHATPFL